MSEYVVEAFGLNDKVLDTKSHELHCLGNRLSTVIIDDDRAIISGKNAIYNRIANGFSFPIESSIEDNFTGICRIPVCALWNKFIISKENSKAKISVKLRNYSKNKEFPNYDVYVDELLCNHLENLVKQSVKNFSKEDHFIIPIPNELTEYAQEYLIRNLKKDGIEVTFIWREVAAIMQFLEDKKNTIQFKEGQRIKVVYLGIDSFESCVFELQKHNDVLLPVRRRPSAKKNMLSGFDFLHQNLVNYFKNSGRERLSEDKVIWQILNTRQDGIESVFGFNITPTTFPIDSGNIELLDTIKCFPLIKEQIHRSNIFEQTADLPPCNKNLSICDFVVDNTEPYDDILLCGQLSNKDFCERMKRSIAYQTNANIWYSDKDLILDGSKLYKHNIDNELPTYLDSLPPLAIAYLEEEEYKWEYLVKENQLVAGGKEFVSPNPFDKFALRKNVNRIPIYLKVESNDPTDDGIHFEEKQFEKAPQQDLRLSMTVSMKPAFGLAKVTIKDDADFFPKSGFIFDYSKMKKSSLPEVQLSYPKEIKIKVDESNEINETLQYVFDKIRIKQPYTDRDSVFEFAESLKELNKKSFKLVTETKGEYFQIFNQDLYAGNRQNQTVLDEVLKICENYFLKIDVDKILSNATTTEARKFLSAISYLYKGTPTNIKNCMLKALNPWMNTISPYAFFYPCCRSLYTSEENIRRIFNYFNSLDSKSRNKNYIAWGISWLLKYISVAKKCLDVDTASNLVCMSRDIFKESVQEKNFKNKFISGTTILLLSLKYRFNDGNFLTKEYSNPRTNGVLDEIYYYLDKGANILKNSYMQKDKNYLSKLLTYHKEIQNFIDKKGNQDFLIKLDNDASEED